MSYGPLLIFIGAVLWGLDGILRRSLYGLPPATIVFYEHLIGAILIAPFLWKAWKQETLGKNEWTALALVSLLSGVLGTLFFTTALLKVNYIPFSVVFLLQKLQPIFAITTAIIFLKEPIKKRYLTWALLAIAAAYFVTFKDGVVNLETGSGTVVAALFALGAAFAWGSSTTFSKMALGKVDFKVSTFYRFLITLIVALPLLLLYGKTG